MHICEKGHEIDGVNQTRSGNYVQCRYCKNMARRRRSNPSGVGYYRGYVPFVVWLRQEFKKANLPQLEIVWRDGAWRTEFPYERIQWPYDGSFDPNPFAIQRAYRDAFIDAVKSNDKPEAVRLLQNPPPRADRAQMITSKSVVEAVFTAWAGSDSGDRVA